MGLDAGPAQTYPAPQVVPQPLPPPERYTRPPREAPAVVLYDQYDFSGSSAPVSGSVDNLDVTSWNDRAVSMVINYGNWELCTDANFRGACQVYGPGSYRDLGNDMVRRLSSLRPAVRLGRCAATRAPTDASSGKTWYFFASATNIFRISATLSGCCAAMSTD